MFPYIRLGNKRAICLSLSPEFSLYLFSRKGFCCSLSRSPTLTLCEVLWLNFGFSCGRTGGVWDNNRQIACSVAVWTYHSVSSSMFSLNTAFCLATPSVTLAMFCWVCGSLPSLGPRGMWCSAYVWRGREENTCSSSFPVYLMGLVVCKAQCTTWAELVKNRRD